MNILMISNKAIYPPDGGSIAVLNLAKGYVQNGCKIHILNMQTHKHSNNINILENQYVDSILITGVNVNTKVSPFNAIINLIFSKNAYIAKRFVSKKYTLKLIEIIKNTPFNFIQIEGLFVLQYIHIIRKYYQGKIIYRPHNMEYIIWKNNSEATKSYIKKLYFRNLYKRLKRLELKLLNTYDYIAPISDTDAKEYKAIGNNKPLFVATFGIDFNKFEKYLLFDSSSQQQSINFIGALDWIPNQEGLCWFIDKCFPVIINEYPEIKLNVAGRNAPGWLIKKLDKKNIHYIGEVEDAYKFIRNEGPVIVPLFSGSGIRVKIIESMALQKAIVATETAVKGIKCTDKKHIFIANNIHDFCQSVSILLKNNALQQEIGENAFKFVKKHFELKKVALDTINFIKE